MINIFGYAKAFVPNLRFREYDKYKAYYCGVCKAMGALLGQRARISLTYESAVLAMLVDYCAFDSEVPLKTGHCAVHPMRRHPYFYGTPGITFAARVNILLSGMAAADKVSDGQRGLRNRAALSAWKKGMRRAAEAYPELNAFIREKLAELRAFEKSGSTDVDGFTEPFAEIMARIFTVDGLASEKYAEPLSAMGHALGGWIMLIDALDDRAKDAKNGSFNIYNKKYATSPLPPEEGTVRLRYMLEVNDNWQLIRKLRYGSGLNGDPDTEGFLDNLFTEGMPYTDRTIAEKKDYKPEGETAAAGAADTAEAYKDGAGASAAAYKDGAGASAAADINGGNTDGSV